jgi:hypothetical protein
MAATQTLQEKEHRSNVTRWQNFGIDADQFMKLKMPPLSSRPTDAWAIE